ncbi:ABC transporter permease [Clostridium butyricum]|uniref:ABC transporter permease n=1 Tax=Clostridium butyricum TaxID=1492 RepID=UPI0013F7D49F|nr:ABC transporter permease [Clostridium butyricum]MCQ2012674.1 ABC transporter permease [Clostridium butyricum]MCQ2017033.1 ABC transporter permease [Clostridium butyricum]MCQ2020933.1 ABC transporter permease [Clostridium butyricum]MCQ2025084.1 ABC transporter permease [Clostridium butyricum]NFB72074.1 ABC transporter permease [Clostridium butyricum]
MINITKIAKKNLNQNKSKSILIIITIMLSTTLLAAIGMTCVDWSAANKATTIKYSGKQHGVYADINEKKYEEIKAHSDIEKIGIVNGIGVKSYEDKTKIGLMYMDENAAEFNNIKLIDGKLPYKKNEIVLDDLALEHLGYEKKLGQEIKIDYEDYTKKGVTSTVFILTGIIETDSMDKIQKEYKGIVSKEYHISTRDMSKEEFNAYVTIKGANKLKGYELIEKVEKVSENLDIPKDKVLANEDYINTLKPDKQVIIGGLGVSIVVVLASVLVIYNIFYLSIVNKVQEFGKLRAIGATKKQIKSIVLQEGMILSLIAIPLGIVLGYVINEFVISKILFQELDESKLPIAIGVVIISFATVFLSLLKPMKIASRVSIVDAVRYNGEKISNKKTRKGYYNINLKKLSYANIKRNKKSAYITILSLSLSGIIFISISSIMNSIDPEKLARVNFASSDIKMSLYGYTLGYEENPDSEINILQMKNPLNSKFIKNITEIDGVKEIKTSNFAKVELKEYKTEYKHQALDSIDESDGDRLQSNLQSGKIDMEKLKSGEEVILLQSEALKNTNIKVGDNITLTLYDGNKKIDKEFKVQAISLEMGDFAVHNEAFDKLFETDTTTLIKIYTESDKYESIKTYIENIDNLNDNLIANFIDEDIEKVKLSIGKIKAIGYSLVIIIGVIGFMNLINSTITSIITRKKELGMLQAIGLTEKQLVRMLNLETMYYIGSMLISSLTLGTIIGYISVQIYKKSGASYVIYEFPIVQAVIMIIFSVVPQLVLTYLTTKNFNKESIIDRIRHSE